MTVARADMTVFEDEVRLSSMRRTPEELVDWLFRSLPFPNGFILLSGTSMVPPPDFTLRFGDTIRIQVPGIGTLTNYVGEIGKDGALRRIRSQINPAPAGQRHGVRRQP